MAKRVPLSTIISETPLSVYQESALWRAPRKSLVTNCRVQEPPSGRLQKEWGINENEKLGYHFNYGKGEVSFYRLCAGEAYGPGIPEARFTSNDWGVMSSMLWGWLRGEPIPDCDSLGGILPEAEEGADNVVRNIKVVWETKCDPSTRWFSRLSFDMRGKSAVGELIVETFSSENGVFFQNLRVPVDCWLKMLNESGKEIDELFRSCRRYKDISMVKRNLSSLF